MKKLILWLAAILILSSCGSDQATPDKQATATPKTLVTVTTIGTGNVADNLELFASTYYLKRNVVTAPIPSFITRVYVRLGDRVKKGQVLYELESKERKAMGGKAIRLDSTLMGFGLVQVKAHASGIVSTLDKQQTGDYVLEGTQLCTITENGDLAFKVNVPYQFTRYTKPGKKCQVVLPDNSVYTATITTPLTTMNVPAQTQTMLAKTSASLFLPENLIVKVLVSKGTNEPIQVVPKSWYPSGQVHQPG